MAISNNDWSLPLVWCYGKHLVHWLFSILESPPRSGLIIYIGHTSGKASSLPYIHGLHDCWEDQDINRSKQISTKSHSSNHMYMMYNRYQHKQSKYQSNCIQCKIAMIQCITCSSTLVFKRYQYLKTHTNKRSTWFYQLLIICKIRIFTNKLPIESTS